nr:MAG TPA: hypothetical protein [Caudoviricetes sp.]
MFLNSNNTSIHSSTYSTSSSLTIHECLGTLHNPL